MNHFYVQCRPEEKIKILEKKVNDLIEESCMAHANGDLQLVSENVAINKFSELCECKYVHGLDLLIHF